MTSKVTKISVIGGSYGGLSFIVHFIKGLLDNPAASAKAGKQFEITLVEPRAGFIQILGIPKSIIDVNFAGEIYHDIRNFNLKFNRIESTDPSLTVDSISPCTYDNFPANVKLNYIQGRVVEYTDENNATYQLNGSDETRSLSFDYSILATGRRRAWPFDPKGTTKQQFVCEMAQAKAEIEKASIITIIGAGALGIEVAGEIKQDFPEKRVILVHPHGFLPPEKFGSKAFREKVETAVREVGIELKLNTRIAKQLSDRTLVTTTGESIRSDLNYWCNFHHSNLEPVKKVFSEAIDVEKDEIAVEDTLLVKGSSSVFAVGDINNLPIMKTAGAAFHSSCYVAQTLVNLLVLDKEEYSRVDLPGWTADHGIVFVVGNKKAIRQHTHKGDGRATFDDEDLISYYSDYGNESTRARFNFISHHSGTDLYTLAEKLKSTKLDRN